MEPSSSSSLPSSSASPPPASSLSSSTSSNQNNTSSAASSSTPSPSRPQPITRLSSRALRPQLLGVEPSTRMRSRSVTSSSTPRIGQGDDGDLSPTLMGEAQFGDEEQIMGVTVREEGEDEGTRTPPDSYLVEKLSAPDRPNSNYSEERDRQSERIGAKLDGSRTIERKRGRSFTSLLIGGIGVGGRSSSPSIEYNNSPTTFAEGAREATIFESFSIPSTPRTSTDSISLLPLSTHQMFSPPSKPSKSLLSFLPQLGYLLFLISTSSLVIFGLLCTLPSLSLPHTISDLPSLYTSLSTYAQTSSFASLHLFLVLSSVYLWKQCFSIPGSLLSNVLLGAMYGTGWGTFWACAGTAGGSTGAYWVARGVGPLVEYYFEKPLNLTKKALNLPVSQDQSYDGSFSIEKEMEPIPTPASQSDLFSHLLLARFFPLLPYSVLNIIAGVLHLPLSIFFSTLFIGSFPFNFCTVSLGSIIQLAASTASDSSSDGSAMVLDKVWSKEVLIKLVLVTGVSVLPLVFKKRLMRTIPLLGRGLANARSWLSSLVDPLSSPATTSLQHRDEGIGGIEVWWKKLQIGGESALKYVELKRKHSGPDAGNVRVEGIEEEIEV